MTTQHRYSLERGSKKHHCPRCEKKRFVRYIDTQDGNYIPTRYGRCDREVSCGYHLNPYNHGFSKAHWRPSEPLNSPPVVRQREEHESPRNKPKRSFIPTDVLKQTCDGYEKNTFVQNLLTNVAFPFDIRDVENVIGMYHLGTVRRGYRSGATTFPFIDIKNRIRAIQVKQFDGNNHTTGTDFLHSIIERFHTKNNMTQPVWLEAYNKNETKVSCLFGEHLLTKYPYNPIALVEAPKTAIYGTLYFGCPNQPKNLLWLAVYNLSSLNLNKCRALKGRNVFLFPDLSKDGKAYQLWSEKAASIQKKLPGTHFQVSDLLERCAPDQDKERGKDIADYLIEQDWRQFRIEEPEQPKSPYNASAREKGEKHEGRKQTFFSPAPLTRNELRNPITSTEPHQKSSENWNEVIVALEDFFMAVSLPTKAIKLNGGATISDCPKFIRSHLNMIKANSGNHTYLPYLQRLQLLQQTLKNYNAKHPKAID